MYTVMFQGAIKEMFSKSQSFTGRSQCKMLQCLYELGVFTSLASRCSLRGKLLLPAPPLPSSFETLPVPLPAETQGAEITSRFKRTLVMARIPPLLWHSFIVLTHNNYNPIYTVSVICSLYWRGYNVLFVLFDEYLNILWFHAGWLTLMGSGRMSNNMAKIADARKTVEQLKLEVNIERMMVSQCIITAGCMQSWKTWKSQ